MTFLYRRYIVPSSLTFLVLLMQDPDHPNKENLIDLEVKVRFADYRYVTAFARCDITDEESNVSSNSVWVLRPMTS